MTVGEWPSREEWVANAERSVRLACYPTQRVPDKVLAWKTSSDLDLLSRRATGARRGLHRVAHLLGTTETRKHATLDQVEHELREVHKFLRSWAEIQDGVQLAASQAVDDAVTAETDRRKTDEAWERELNRRAEIDGEWVL